MNIEALSEGHNKSPASLKNRVNQFRGTGVTFGDLIKERVHPQELRFSTHAENRIRSRGIELTPELKAQLNSAVSSVAAKGGRDTVVLTGNSAFIVNVPSRTVVTAMDRNAMKDTVITNIDSATIV